MKSLESFFSGPNFSDSVFFGGPFTTAVSSGVSTPSGSATITTQTSITHRGVTFNFDRAVDTCVSCLGEPAVISNQAFNITSITPESVGVAGSGGTFIANGAMQDPEDLSDNNAQGFDELLGENDGAGQSVSQVSYVSADNVDPAINGSISITLGQTTSIVKSVRVSSVTETSGDWRTIEDYVVLSVLDAVPDQGFFRPGMAPGTKTIYGKESDINYNIFQNFTAPSGLPDLSSAEDSLRETYPYFGISNQEKMRRFDVQNDNNHSTSWGASRADIQALLHTNLSDSDKRTLTLRSVQHGIDLAQAYANGYIGQGGAGQNYGRSFFSYTAAFALGSTTLLTAAQDLIGGALQQHFWALDSELEADVFYPSTGGGENERNNAPLIQSDLNIPEWDREPGDETRRDAGPSARYRQFWPIGMMEALNIAMLQNGPNGLTGVEAILEENAFDETNPKAAALAYYDRNRNWPVDFGAIAETGNSTDRFARWDAWRPSFGVTPWTGRPDWVSGDGQVTAGADGELDYDWSDHNWATETITQRDLRYSLDGRQWIELPDVAASGSFVVPMRGIDYQVGFRLVSASGAGRWSPTWPSQGPLGANPNVRNSVSATGTETAAAPVNTVAPLVMKRDVPNWEGSDMSSTGASFSSSDLLEQDVLYAGVGQWTGYPAPTFSYQWQLDGVDISGETDDSISLFQRFDASFEDISCVITATNASGTVTASTQSVTLPEITAPDPYLADFSVSDASSGYVGHNGGTFAYVSPVLEVDFNEESFPGVTTEAIEVVPGRTYDVEIDITSSTTRTHEVIIGSTAGGENIEDSSPTFNTAGDHTFTMTITPTVSEIYITVRVQGGTIANTGFDLKRISVSEQVAPVTYFFEDDFTTEDARMVTYAGNGNSTITYDTTDDEYDINVTNRTGGAQILYIGETAFVNGDNYEIDFVIDNAAVGELRFQIESAGTTFVDVTGTPTGTITLPFTGSTSSNFRASIRAEAIGNTGLFSWSRVAIREV